MSRILLDTISLIWLDQKDKRLGRQSRKLIENALAEASLFISPLSFWEIGLLRSGKRMVLRKAVDEIRIEWVEAGVKELPVTGRVAHHALAIPPYHTDPIDCLMMGTAMAHNMVLLTSDDKILAWKGTLERQDALK